MRKSQTTRRRVLLGAAVTGAAAAMPAVLRAQSSVLKITTWGGKWGEIMKGKVLPAFEKEFKCTVEADQAFPYLPKLQASPKAEPLYDVLHSTCNEQWQAVAHSDGTYSFEPRNNTANCLDVTDVSTADGAVLQQWACSGGSAQSFRLTAQS